MKGGQGFPVLSERILRGGAMWFHMLTQLMSSLSPP